MVRIVKRTVVVLLLLLAGALALRMVEVMRGPALQPWHRFRAPELSAARSTRPTGRLAGGRERGLRGGPARSDRQAAAGAAHALEPLLRRQPIYPGRFRQGLEPLLHARPARPAHGRGGAAARPDRFSLQPAPCRRALPRARLRGGGDPACRAMAPCRPGSPTCVGGLVGRDAARRARGPPPRAGAAPLHVVGFSNGGALATKYALDAIADDRAGAARPPDPDLADDRHHRACALRRRCRLAGDLSGLRQGRLARHRAGVQPVQVQLVPGQRRAPVVAADARPAGASRRARREGRLAHCRRSSPSSR